MRTTLAEAARQLLVEDGRPVISSRDLRELLQRLYAGEYADRVETRVRKSNPSDEDIYRAYQRLKDARVVREDPDFGASLHQVFDVLDQSAELVCCVVDPLCYLSHLSAMQVWGLTERSPTHLTLTRPADPLWREMLATYHVPLGEPPTRPRPKRAFPDMVRGRPVLVHDTRHPGAWEASGRFIRIASVGQTFLDTVSRPAWCGGMAHVLEIWEREAEAHLEAIILAVDAAPAKLPKVRAGYILDEMLGVSDPRVLVWRTFAQRGSSQKLDPEKPYAPTYSEAWMLSLNA